MSIHHRPYDDARNDFERIWKYLIQDYAYRTDRFIWLFSRFGDWKYGLYNYRKYVPTFLRKNAQLWLNEFEDLEGFVIAENGDHNFTLFTRRGYEHLTGEMLDWVVANWSDRGAPLNTEVHEYQEPYMRALDAKGFRNRGPIATTREYDLTVDLKQGMGLAAGFRIVNMAANPDFRSKKALQNEAFQRKGEVSEIDLLAIEYACECPAYHPAYDLSVVDSEGMHVSSCVGFVDNDNRVSEVEKVCTHSQYRKRGFAEAVIRECFARLKRDGFETAYITGYSGEANGVYERLGPVKRKQWCAYEKEGE